MKTFVLVFLLFTTACGSKVLSEGRSRELAKIEFQKICLKIGASTANYSEPTSANVRGKDVGYSYIWHSTKGERSIIVRVENDGWTEASFGVDQDEEKGAP